MSNPVELFVSLKNTYLRYLDSPFDLRYPDLVLERRSLLDQDGRIYRRPLVEPVPQYRTCNQNFSQLAQALLGNLWPQADIVDLSDFVSLDLFPPNDPQ